MCARASYVCQAPCAAPACTSRTMLTLVLCNVCCATYFCVALPCRSPTQVYWAGPANRLYITIPKVLVCSQLPADTTYPLDISLRVLPPPDGQEQGQWTARICQHGTLEAGVLGWVLPTPCQPMQAAASARCPSARTGSSHSPLHQHQQHQQQPCLPVPSPTTSAAPVQAAPQAPCCWQHRQQQPVAAGQGSGSSRGMSAAAAAAGGTSGQTAAAAHTQEAPADQPAAAAGSSSSSNGCSATLEALCWPGC